MIKLKKIMALGLSALMVTSLVGCGGTTNATENKKSDSSKGTEITFWNSFTGADGDMLVNNHIWIIVQMMTKRILYHFR